jgi:RNA polymerase sigma factor (sigma-70 family)
MPGILRTMDNDTREDIIQEVLVHCWKDDCVTLKKYDPSKGAFASWFYKVAYRKTLTEMDRRGMKPVGDDVDDYTLDTEDNTAKPFTNNDLLELIWKHISSLGERCRLLLKLAAEEFKPREIVETLGLTKEANVQIAAELRECRRRLKNALEQNGVEYGEMFHDL